MYILGISCYYHDAAVCLLKDGVVVAAVQEERFSHIKHDWHFPSRSIRYCLDHAGISIHDVNRICFYEKPFIKFERVLETFLATAPRGLPAFLKVIPSWLKEKIRVRQVLERECGFRGRFLYAEHHLAHAASAFFASPFDEAALLTIDGVGEWSTAAYGKGRGNTVSLSHEMKFPDSLGLLYTAITTFLGFHANNDEYKVMGMAAYGKPAFYSDLMEKVVLLKPDGSLNLNLDYFGFQYGRRMYDEKKMTSLFGVLPRVPGSEITCTHFDIAASLQKITEEAVLRMAVHVQKETGSRNLCMAGGVALNSVTNGRLLREGPFDSVFIQPAAGDAGGAFGSAYLAYHHDAGKRDRHALENVYLGPAYSASDVRSALEGMRYQELDEPDLLNRAARLLSDGKVIGWFQGRMEFGPRALGNRSILADPRSAGMKDTINRKVKYREAFRPFAPVVIAEDADQFFRIPAPSPYMLFTVPVISDRIPAVTHADGSARVQTLRFEDNPRLYRVLQEFKKITGIPVLVNTSLNIKGAPIAMSPADAVRSFAGSDMDALVLENFVVMK